MLAGLSQCWMRRMPPGFCARAGKAARAVATNRVAMRPGCRLKIMFPPDPDAHRPAPGPPKAAMRHCLPHYYILTHARRRQQNRAAASSIWVMLGCERGGAGVMFEGFTRTEIETPPGPFGNARIHLRHGGDGPPL